MDGDEIRRYCNRERKSSSIRSRREREKKMRGSVMMALEYLPAVNLRSKGNQNYHLIDSDFKSWTLIPRSLVNKHISTSLPLFVAVKVNFFAKSMLSLREGLYSLKVRFA